jgi:Domain of unknown function (DUF1707)
MDDRIRVSDADRDRVTARLRENFAEGRLTQDELDERVSAALNAKTFGDLRPVMADLPEPAPAPVRPARSPQWPGPPWMVLRRGPRLLPLVLIALLVAGLASGGGGWVLFAFFRLLLVFWLVTFAVGIFAAGRFRRRLRRGEYPGHHSRQWWI